MKKLLAIILVFTIVVSLAACGKKANEESEMPNENVQVENEVANGEVAEDKQEEVKEDKDTTKKPENVQTQKPAEKPQTQEKPVQKPAEKPAEQPQQKPAEKPVEKPAETPVATTLGKTLLADFKTKAVSGMSAQEIADGLLANPAIKFSGGAMPVEEGLLSGFDNAEIKGFKSGIMFAPMIGSIPFVGYVFEIENASDASSFIANLEKNANRRWNICVEADEMVTGSAGNKVFFVMCPTTLEE